jgi:hypothetical protein
VKEAVSRPMHAGGLAKCDIDNMQDTYCSSMGETGLKLGVYRVAIVESLDGGCKQCIGRIWENCRVMRLSGQIAN